MQSDLGARRDPPVVFIGTLPNVPKCKARSARLLALRAIQDRMACCYGYRWKARSMKTAISARVTLLVGQ